MPTRGGTSFIKAFSQILRLKDQEEAFGQREIKHFEQERAETGSSNYNR